MRPATAQDDEGPQARQLLAGAVAVADMGASANSFAATSALREGKDRVTADRCLEPGATSGPPSGPGCIGMAQTLVRGDRVPKRLKQGQHPARWPAFLVGRRGARAACTRSCSTCVHIRMRCRETAAPPPHSANRGSHSPGGQSAAFDLDDPGANRWQRSTSRRPPPPPAAPPPPRAPAAARSAALLAALR